METVQSILMVLVVIVVGFLGFLFRCWFYGKGGPIDSFGISEDDQTNLAKLRDRGVITQQQYEDAISKLQGKQ